MIIVRSAVQLERNKQKDEVPGVDVEVVVESRSSGAAARVEYGKTIVMDVRVKCMVAVLMGCCCAFSRPTSCGSKGRPAP